ncbi:ABC-2 transporter permease [Paenibacillus sp. NPDC057967]|uniref:ABC-2 transporter permease n=1 Tax=Paenibacillus sp. NPDC057967 TaxID=3346293 RepID=UPI0036DD36E8
MKGEFDIIALFYLLRKDFIGLRWYFPFVAIFALIFGWNFRTSVSPLLILVLPTVMMVMLTASIEFRSKSMMFVSTLPINRKQIVLAKYTGITIQIQKSSLHRCKLLFLYCS